MSPDPRVTAAAVTQAKQRAARHHSARHAEPFADAMDCAVVHYLIPRAGSLDAAVSKRLDTAADALSRRVWQSMALEDQTAEGGGTKLRLRASLAAG